MIGEIYLQKSAQYPSGEYVEEGNLYKGIFAFMGVGLKESIHLIQIIPEVTFNGQWLAEKISDNIGNLKEIGLCVQGIVADNKLQGIVTDNQLNAFLALTKITL